MKLFSALSFTVFSTLFIHSATNAQTTTPNEFTINQAPITNALEMVLKLKPLHFEFNQQKYRQLDFPSGVQYGFSTDAIKTLFPQAIKTEHKSYPAGKNQFKTTAVDAVALEKLVPFLVSAIQQQQQEIEDLRKQIESSKAIHAK